MADAPAPDAWQDPLFDQIIEHLAASGVPFTADDVWRPEYGLDATQVRHGEVGAAFQRARKRGVIVVVGYQTSRRAARHGCLLRVWAGASDSADTWGWPLVA